MVFGEVFDGTLATVEQDLIAHRCRDALPSHAFALHSNADGVTWAVLTPPAITPELLRFTICRVSPAVMVMIEDAAARRQICGLETVEAAIDLVCEMATEAMQAEPAGDARTVH